MAGTVPNFISQTVPELEILQQLALMLNRETFIKAPREGQLLAYLVEKSLEGKSPSEWEVARDVFHAAQDWTSADRRVAIYTKRLKVRLKQYYCGEGKFDRVVIEIVVRKATAEYRDTAPLIQQKKPSAWLDLDHTHKSFFVSQGGALCCIVTGESEDVDWYSLDDGSSSLGTVIPLCGRLREHLKGLKKGNRTALLPQMHPKRLTGKLAPKYFREWRVADAYGCAALAFYLGMPPFGQATDSEQAFRLCDVIHYARHHFLEPLMHQVLQTIALPFLARTESLDAVAALRLSLQFTALLEEAGYYEDAERALKLATLMRRRFDSSLLTHGSQNAFIFLRRQAQLHAEQYPTSKKFNDLLRSAQEHTSQQADRILTLNVVKVHRALRLGSKTELCQVHEALKNHTGEYQKQYLHGNQWAIPKGLGAADFSEIFLLDAITTCRLQPSGWKQYSEERTHSAQVLMQLGRHILPAEYERFITEATQPNDTTATQLLRRTIIHVRKPLRVTARANVGALIKCLARLRLIELRDAGTRDQRGPDL